MAEPKQARTQDLKREEADFKVQELTSEEEESVAGGSCVACGGVCTGEDPDQAS